MTLGWTVREYWRFIAFALVWIALIVILASIYGCSLFPTEHSIAAKQESRESVAGKGTTDIVRETKTDPPTVTATAQDGKMMLKVETPVTQTATTTAKTDTSEASDAKSVGSQVDAKTVPFATKLLIGGVGLVVIAVGLSMLIAIFRKSAAIRAAWATGDQLFAGAIGKIELMAAAETDPHKSNVLNSVIAAMQSDRAEFNKD